MVESSSQAVVVQEIRAHWNLVLNAINPPSGNEMHRLLIVDDHPIMRRGLAQLLDGEPGLVVGGQADNAAQALALLRTQAFDLVILDVSLQGVSGIDLLKDIRIHWPKLPVLVLSMHDETLYAERALRAGARGYVMKQEESAHVVTAVRRLLAGQLYVSEKVNGLMLSKLLEAGVGSAGKPGGNNVIDLLSNRELEVFQLLGRGRGTRAIAEEMHVSIKTVETYRAHIKEKLQLKTSPEMVRYAVHWVNEQEQG